MSDFEVIIHFSNGDKVTIDEKSFILPIKLVEYKDEKFCSKLQPLNLEEVFHIHDGYIPELTTFFALNEFFTIDEIDSYNKKVYKTSSIVMLEQIDKR
ncbi:hypothetical protein [Oceanobacillus kapialis]|uniref:Uncharacterized protein n=1 Tax=Oceanobacillus kapialis TaxID=481353 RepID=A0ABW5PZB4_9BACI